MADAPAAAPAAPSTSNTAPQSSSPAGSSSDSGKPTQQSAQPQSGQQSGQNKTWKSKVNGKDVTWDKEEDLVRDAGLGKAAFEKMREAADLKKTVEGFWEQFKKDPMGALENPALGLTAEQRRDLIEKYYQKAYLEQDALTPEQKRLRELEAEIARRDKEVEDKRKADEEAQKTQQQKALEAKWQETYQQQIIEAIEKGGFPKTPRTAARVAFYMAQAAEAGFDAPIETIIAQVGKDYEDEFTSILSENVPMEAILKVLPKGFIKRLRQYDLDQYKAKQAKLNAPPVQEEVTKTRSSKKDQRPTYAEVLRKFGT